MGQGDSASVLTQAKVWKTREYWMYFPFFILHDWGKMSVEARSSHLSGVALRNSDTVFSIELYNSIEKTVSEFLKATPLRWELRASTDILPQSCRMKNGKYIQYSRVFHTFAWVKTLAESPCPIMRCFLNKICPRKFVNCAPSSRQHNN